MVARVEPVNLLINEIMPYRCIGCSACVQTCPNDVIRMKRGKASIVYQADCAACYMCVEDCPREAISLGVV
ncbi:ferredoxin family protein [Chloroflexota bacterium]